MDFASGAGVMGGAHVGARLIMSPRFVRWLNGIPAQRTRGRVASHVAQLRLIARQEPELSSAVNQFANQLARLGVAEATPKKPEVRTERK